MKNSLKVAWKMKKIDSQVITHIEEAKNWLDEAKDDYIQSNNIHGDLNLNLAQAEVKCAWELSHNQNVKHIIDQAIQSQSTGRMKYYFPVAAASVLILSFLGVGLYWGTGMLKPNLTAKTDNIKPTRQAPAKIAVIDVRENQMVSDTSGKENDRDKDLANRQQNVAVRKRNLPAVAQNLKTRPSVKAIVAVEPKVIPVNKEKPSVKVSRNSTENALTPVSVIEPVREIREIIETKSEPEKPREMAQVQPKPALVPLLIDEEALTKEASYSLRNGK
jgi:hypothetical protein